MGGSGGCLDNRTAMHAWFAPLATVGSVSTALGRPAEPELPFGLLGKMLGRGGGRDVGIWGGDTGSGGGVVATGIGCPAATSM